MGLGKKSKDKAEKKDPLGDDIDNLVDGSASSSPRTFGSKRFQSSDNSRMMFPKISITDTNNASLKL